MNRFNRKDQGIRQGSEEPPITGRAREDALGKARRPGARGLGARRPGGPRQGQEARRPGGF